LSYASITMGWYQQYEHQRVHHNGNDRFSSI